MVGTRVNEGNAYPRVLHVIGSLDIGGAERQLIEFITRSTDPSMHQVAVFDRPGTLADRLPKPPITVGSISRRPSDIATNVRTARALRGVAMRGGFSIVHAHLAISELLALATPRYLPVIASRRGRSGRYEDDRVFRTLEGLAHRRTRVMICNSKYLEDRTRRRDLSPPPTRVIYNAVDLQRFSFVPPVTGPPKVAIVANLRPEKAHDRLLAALWALRSELPDIELTIVGDGTERRGLEQRVRELGVESSVTFAGEVIDPRPYLRAAHVVALVSDHEGFPNALLEAMATGRPVVATRVGGIPELVRDGQDGFLTSLDPADIAAHLARLLGDSDLLARMGLSARAQAETFTWDRTVAETEAVYREVLTSARR